MRNFLLIAMLSTWSGLFAQQRLIEGDPKSAVRVIIYEDLQCSDCADFRKMMDEQLLPRFGTKVAFEHRDFPLAKHTWARKGAIASRFFEHIRPQLALEFRRYLLQNMKQISADTFDEKLAAFAKSHGADPVKAVAALDDAQLTAMVEKDFQEGIARGIAKTPTALVNGQPFIEHFEFREIARAIDEELSALK